MHSAGVITVTLVIHTPDVLLILYCFTETDFEDFFLTKNNDFLNFPDSFLHVNKGHNTLYCKS